MPLPKTAYIDESLRVSHGLYVLAAVIVADTEADQHRTALRALLLRGQLRLHWRDESTARRNQLISAMSALRHTGAIVIATDAASRRQERARRKCIERLLAQLASRAITTVVFERRHPDLDAQRPHDDRRAPPPAVTACRHARGLAKSSRRASAVAARHRGRSSILSPDRRRHLLDGTGLSLLSRALHRYLTPDSAKPGLPSSGGLPGPTSRSPRRTDTNSLPNRQNAGHPVAGGLPGEDE